MRSFAEWGNDLYTGRKSYPFVAKRMLWYAISAVLIAVCAFGIFGKGLNFGIEFRGGSELRVTSVQNMDNYETRARDVVAETTGTTDNINVTRLGDSTVRIQTQQIGEADDEKSTEEVRGALEKEFGVSGADVTASYIGPSWGETVSKKAIQALVVFLVLVTIVLAMYFRTWKMSVAALIALMHDLVFTIGAYALAGFEISPASMIGFLTILGYSLYDTVVVFDKLKENADEAERTGKMTYAQAANLAINQTLVRSINTSVVALLPVGAILAIGFTILGPGTLLDLALALFIGITVGTFSSVFLAAPVLVHLRQGEPGIKALDKRARAYQAEHEGELIGPAGVVKPEDEKVAEVDDSDEAAAVTAGAGRRELHPRARGGTRASRNRSRNKK